MNMSIQTQLRRALKPVFARLLMSLPDGVQRTLMLPLIRRYVIHVPLIKGVYSGCYRQHPIDSLLGVDTSGFVEWDGSAGKQSTSEQNNAYIGCQPSILRRALDSLPVIHDYTFLDLGCGKGRAMIVATEYPFTAVLGCDINPHLVASANANAQTLKTRFPDRADMCATVSDVRALKFPLGKLVVFLYNPFGPKLMTDVLSGLLKELHAGSVWHIFLVYYNPVAYSCIDANPGFKRWSATTYNYAPDEINFGPSTRDTVVVWQSVKNAIPGASSSCMQQVRVDGATACLD